MRGFPPLRALPLPVRVGLTGILLVLVGGYAASLAWVVQHHGKKDGAAGFSLDDLTAAYHGLQRQAPLLRVVQGEHGRRHLQGTREQELLRTWLSGDRVSEDYDSLELGEDAPAEILARRCLECHARGAYAGGGAGQRVLLEYWDDVRRLAFSQELNPVPLEILLVSTHTHAIAMALLTLGAAGLFLLTRWPPGVRHGVFLVAGAALCVDLAGWWMARSALAGVWMVAAGGGLYAAALAAALLGTLLDLWLPCRRRLQP